MGANVGQDIIRSYLVELQPHLNQIDEGLRELGRIAPDALAVSEAIQSIALVRGSSDVLALNELNNAASSLEQAVGNVQEYSSARRIDSHEHLLHLAMGLRRASEHVLVDSTTMVIQKPRDPASSGDTTENTADSTVQALASTSDTVLDETTILTYEVTHDGPPRVDAEVREIFHAEARELFDAMTACAAVLTRRPDDNDALGELLRTAHTLKGASNMTGFPLVGSIGGALEGLLDVYAEHEMALDRSTLELIIIARRFLGAMLESLDDLATFERPVRLIEIRCAQLRDAIVPHEREQIRDTPMGDNSGTAEFNESDTTDVDAQIVDEYFVTTHETADAEQTTDSVFASENVSIAEDHIVSWFESDEASMGLVDQPWGQEDNDLHPSASAPVNLDDSAVRIEEIETSDDDQDEPTADPDVNLYDLATEIANMARVQSGLRPHNAAIMPDDFGSLTDRINELTAEIEPPGTDELDIARVAENHQRSDGIAPADTHATHATEDRELSSSSQLTDLSGLSGRGASELGSALLNLALGGGLSSYSVPSPAIPSYQITDLPVDGPELEREIRATFRREAAELIDALTRAAMAMDATPEAHEPRSEAYRLLHTLKGAAAIAGFDTISHRCHLLEDVLEDHGVAADPVQQVISDIFAMIRDVEQELDASDDAADGAASDDVSGARVEQATAVRVDTRQLDGLLNLVGELVVNRSTFEERLQRFGAAIDELSLTAERLRRSSQQLEQDGFDARTLRHMGTLSQSRASDAGREDEFDALELDRYTEIDRLARELTEVASDIGAASNELSYLQSDFDTISARQQRLTTAMQDDLMGVRMVPARALAPRLYRIVKSVAQERGKQVDFVLEGGATPFDTTLLAGLSDSLAHLLRNAVDHGIESPEERQRRGKPLRGTVRVRAYRDGNEAVIEVTDDGRGIDRDAIAAQALALGIPISSHSTHDETLGLILMPGFSTRESADEVSGRGVGLDVVQNAVARLKGRVTIDSRPDAGTTFRLRLPVVLAVSQAFLVMAGGQRYAIPVGNVEFIAQRRGARIRQFGESSVVEINDATLPIFDLGQRIIGTLDDALDRDDGWLLIVRAGEDRWAVRVDTLDGQHEIVVKPLGRFLGQTQGIVGATILGTGEVALIVDIPHISTSRRANATMRNEINESEPVASSSETPRQRIALIVDDSLSVRKVLSTTLSRHGWLTLDARDGVEALEILDFNAVDVVVTDIEMPRMDGFELTAATRRHREHREIPIVVLTSRSSDKHRGKALELGADAYLVKPFQEQELLATLNDVIRIPAKATA